MGMRMVRVAATALLLVSSVPARGAGPEQMAKGAVFSRPPSGYRYDTWDAHQSLQILKDSVGANWVTVVPIWWQRDTGATSIYFRPDSSPSDAEIRQAIRWARDCSLRVMLKPEVRCSSGVWIGRHKPNSTWFNYYRVFIGHYAQIAQQEGCDLLSVGTSLDSAADDLWEQTEWREVIDVVKALYLGPVTYAADWRTFRKIAFWDSLDYVGINAYFPLHEVTQPVPLTDSIGYFASSWKERWIPEIESFLDSTQTFGGDKPVLFTEIGYRSIQGSARYPWDNAATGTCDLWEQRCAYIAALHSLLGQPWFAGWFWREWTTDPSQGGPNDISYSPKGKPAGTAVRHWYRAIETHRAATVFTPQLSPGFYSEAGPVLDSLVSAHANWVAISPWWWISDTGALWDTIEPNQDLSPTDASMRTAIELARSKGLKVMLAPHLVCLQNGMWTNGFNPHSLPSGELQEYFHDYRSFIAHYAQFAEEESCDLLSVGNELNGTTDHQSEVALWRDSVITAARDCYSGPLTYNAFWGFLDDRQPGGPADTIAPALWDALDFVGVNAYFQLYQKEKYAPGGHWLPAETSRLDQHPNADDLREGTNPYNMLAWEQKWLPSIESLHVEVTVKPILFTEIGYGSFDSAAWVTSGEHAPGWSRMSVPCTVNFHAVCFPVDTTTGYVVGDGGVVLKTVNCGETWNDHDIDMPSTFFGVCFPVDTRTGFVVGCKPGVGGRVLKTADYGITWTPMTIHWPSGDVPVLRAVAFPGDSMLGLAAGDDGALLRSTNAGVDWYPCSTGTLADLRGVHFPSSTTGYVVGNGGVVLRTTNAGVTWSRCDAGVTVDLRGVWFRSADTGYVVGDSGFFLMTCDGGDTWTVKTAIDRTWPVPFSGVCYPPRDEDSVPPAPVYVIGDYGRILRVNETGSDLPLYRFHQNVPVGVQHLRAVSFPVDRRVGFAVGDDGVILRTRGGGRTVVDFNEQKNCYEAAFETFWRHRGQPDPPDWFYGMYWWYYRITDDPEGQQYEDWLGCMSPQQKPAAASLKSWYDWPRYHPEQGQAWQRHFPTGELDVITTDNDRSNVPLVLFRLESHDWDEDPTGNTPADFAMLIQEYYGSGQTPLSTDSTEWFSFTEDTSWQYLYGAGSYRFYVRYKDGLDHVSPRYYDFEDTVVVFDTSL